jgi:hypothetical protein
VIPHFDVWSNVVIHSINTKTIIHRILAIRKVRCSVAGKKLPMI